MRFGMQFFPDVREDVKSPVQYYEEAMRLVGLCDEYGYSHVRTVEHYFHHWGGYSSNPIVFLTAACQHTKTARMVTGARRETSEGASQTFNKRRVIPRVVPDTGQVSLLWTEDKPLTGRTYTMFWDW